MLCVVHREASLEAMTVHLSSYSFVSSVLVTTENVDACSARDFLLTQYTPSTYSNVFLPSVFTVPQPSHTGGLRGNKSSPICTPAYTCARQKGDSEAIPLKCKWWSGEISGGMETAFLSLPPWLHADDQSTTNLAGHKSLNKEISIHSSNRKKCGVIVGLTGEAAVRCHSCTSCHFQLDICCCWLFDLMKNSVYVLENCPSERICHSDHEALICFC